MEPYILYLNLFVIINLLIIAISLWLKKESHFANICLILVIMTCVDTCINNIALHYFQNRICHFTQVAFVGFNFCFGCVIFTYVTLLYEKKLPKYWYAHSLPVFIVIGISCRSLWVSEQTIFEEIKLMRLGEFMILNISNALLLLHILVYLIFAKVKLRTYNKDGNLSQTVAAKLKRKWAQDFLNYMVLNTVVLIVSYTIAQAVFNKSFYFCDLVMVPLISISIYGFIIYKNFQFSNIYEKVIIEKSIIENGFLSIKKSKSIIANQEDLKLKMEDLMTNMKLFANPDLNAPKLAEELNITPSILTQLLQDEYDASFFEFVNKYKIDAAKKMLLDPTLQHYKVEAIGEMAGFSSRSSFFSVFKKSTGLSPANYKTL